MPFCIETTQSLTSELASFPSMFPDTPHPWPLCIDKNDLYIAALFTLSSMTWCIHTWSPWTSHQRSASSCHGITGASICKKPANIRHMKLCSTMNMACLKTRLLQLLWISLPASLPIWSSWLLTENGCGDKAICCCMIWLVKSLFGQEIHFCSQTTIGRWKGASLTLLCYWPSLKRD